MKTYELAKRVNGEVVLHFSYRINRNKSFYQVYLNESPSTEQIRIGLDYGVHFVAEILWKNGEKKVIYSSYPIDGESFEFEE